MDDRVAKLLDKIQRLEAENERLVALEINRAVCCMENEEEVKALRVAIAQTLQLAEIGPERKPIVMSPASQANIYELALMHLANAVPAVERGGK